MSEIKLTVPLHAEIVRLVRIGNYKSTALKSMGLTKQQIREWELLGEAGVKPYVQFALDLQRAEAQAEIDLVATYRDPKSTGIERQSTLTFLERRFGSKWSAKSSQYRRESEDIILAKLKANPKLHAEVADAISAEEDSAAAESH